MKIKRAFIEQVLSSGTQVKMQQNCRMLVFLFHLIAWTVGLVGKKVDAFRAPNLWVPNMVSNRY